MLSRAHTGVVTLPGPLPSEQEWRRLAEAGAWCVFGVAGVLNCPTSRAEGGR